jgi:hypothetical protein
MVASLIVFVLGVTVGAATGTVLGALVGGLVGMLLGGLVYAVSWMRFQLRETIPTVEPHSVMCFPYAQAAECELVGDLKSGRWVDVKQCSLHRVPTEVNCDKGCLRMMNLTHVRPGQACRCEAPGPDLAQHA